MGEGMGEASSDPNVHLNVFSVPNSQCPARSRPLLPLPSSASVATPPRPPRARTLRGGDKDEDRALRVGCEGARAVVGVGARREEGVDGALVDVGERRDEAAHVRDQSRNVHRRGGRAAARHRAARAPNNGNAAAGRGKRRSNVVPVHLGEKKLTLGARKRKREGLGRATAPVGAFRA